MDKAHVLVHRETLYTNLLALCCAASTSVYVEKNVLFDDRSRETRRSSMLQISGKQTMR